MNQQAYLRFLTLLVLMVALLTVGIPAWADMANYRARQVTSHRANYVADNTAQPYIQVSDLILQAQQDYEQGKFQQAVNRLEAAVERFERTGDGLQQAIALGNLSLAYQGLRHWSAAQTAIEESFKILEVPSAEFTLEQISRLEQPMVIASALDIYGQLWQRQGDFSRAVETWRQAAALYQIREHAPGWLGSQINQIRALEALGLYQQARVQAEHVGCALGEEIEGVTCSVPALSLEALSSELRVRGLRSLGDTLRQVGELELSRDILEKSQAYIDQSQAGQAVLLSLGNTYAALGTRAKERSTLDNRQGILPWEFVQADTIPTEAEDNYKKAETYFGQVIENDETSTDCPGILPKTISQVQLTAGVMCLAVRLEQNLGEQESQRLWHSLYGRIINEATPNRTLVYMLIRLAKQGAYLNQMLEADEADEADEIAWDQIVGLLQKAIDDARWLQDKPAESYAMGNLGGLYEYFDGAVLHGEQGLQWGNGAREKAESLTRNALLLAQPSTFPEIAYQWQWQLARLKYVRAKDCSQCHQTERQTLTAEVIKTYEQSIRTLEHVRESLLSINADVQFSFRDNIEPIYRELVDLKLQADSPSQEDLRAVVNLIDKLQVSELESFLRCRLTPTMLEQQEIDPHAAVLYPIILRDRIELILALPDGSLQRQRPSLDPEKYQGQDFQTFFQTSLDTSFQASFQTSLNTSVDKFRATVSSVRNRYLRPVLATDFYELLIRPFDLALEADKGQMESTIKILVFVLDGALRNLPMSALRDSQRNGKKGGRFLIERYAVAIAPSLQLIDPDPLPRPLKVLAAGSSEAMAPPFEGHGGFSPLPFVRQEVDFIQSTFKDSERLLNQELTRQKFIQKLTEKQFPIVHLATHGEFSSDPDKTFIMLSDGPFYAADFNTLLRQTITQPNSVKLLVLSACQTSKGDRRAVLGIAGLTVQAGASSALSTLWSVDDKSTANLIEIFYQELQTDNTITKAEALQRAQLKLRDMGWDFLFNWAPYTLVGNWR